MNNRVIIGLLGYARVGKDTIADQLGYQKVSFAAALKHECLPVLRNLSLSLSDAKDKEIARPIMVAVGAAARQLDPDYWIKRAHVPVTGNVVFSDVRYLNEVKHILSLGGVVVEVKRSGFYPANEEERRSFNEIYDWVNHDPRANGISGFHDLPVIHNNSTPEEAAAWVREILRSRGKTPV